MNRQNSNALNRKVRGSYAISTVSIALVLFLLAGVGYIIWNISRATDAMKERMTLYVMLSDNTSQARADEIGASLRALDGVREAVFVPKAQAAADFKEFSGDDFEAFLKYNPLPDSYEVRLVAAASEKENVEAIENQVDKWPGVDEVVYQKSVVDKIGNNLTKFKVVLFSFGAALLVIALILLNNTIRMSVYSRRYLISTMKLVGATRGFIKRPFLLDSLLQGTIAAVIASLMFWGLVVGLNDGLPYVMIVTGFKPLLLMVCSIFAGGILISVLFTDWSLNKFINMQRAKIHLY